MDPFLVLVLAVLIVLLVLAFLGRVSVELVLCTVIIVVLFYVLLRGGNL